MLSVLVSREVIYSSILQFISGYVVKNVQSHAFVCCWLENIMKAGKSGKLLLLWHDSNTCGIIIIME